MTGIRIRQAAELLGVSDDTVRRWIDNGSLAAEKDESGRKVVDGPRTRRVRARQRLEVARSARIGVLGT